MIMTESIDPDSLEHTPCDDLTDEQLLAGVRHYDEAARPVSVEFRDEKSSFRLRMVALSAHHWHGFLCLNLRLTNSVRRWNLAASASTGNRVMKTSISNNC